MSTRVTKVDTETSAETKKVSQRWLDLEAFLASVDEVLSASKVASLNAENLLRDTPAYPALRQARIAEQQRIAAKEQSAKEAAEAREERAAEKRSRSQRPW